MRRHAAGGFRAGMIALAGAVLALTAGCGSDLAGDSGSAPTSTTIDPGPSPGGHLVVSVPAESNGWNPLIDQWTDSGSLVGAAIIEPLAVQDNDGRPQPWLAEKWEHNADYTEWIITVRPNIVFHDGTPLDEVAVKKNIDATANRGFHMVADSPYAGIDIVGPRQVRVKVKSRWVQFPVSLANTWIMAPSMLEADAEEGTRHPVGTGPFVFTSWDQGVALKARRWDRYWRHDDRGRALPYLDEIEFRVVAGEDERRRGLDTGDLDVALSDGGKLATTVDPGKFDVIKDYDGQRTYLMLNTAVGDANKGNPFVNLHARRALAYATDRERIARLVGDGVESSTFGFKRDSIWAVTGDDGYVGYDPARARMEIDAYKRDTGRREVSFKVLGTTSPEVLRVLQALQTDWQAVGVKMEIVGIEPAKVMLLAAMGEYQALWFKFHDSPDPDATTFYLAKENVKPVGKLGINFTRYSSPGIDAAVKALRESTEVEDRKRASDVIVRESNEQVVNLWLYNTPEAIVSAKHVQGLDSFRTHAFANNLPKPWMGEVWLDR